MTWLTVTEYLCHKWPRICSTCHQHYQVLSSFMTYHRICNQSTTGATSGGGPDYPSGTPEFIHGFCGVRISRSLAFCIVFCRSLFVLFSFLFWPCVVCPSLIYGLWLSLWYLLAIVLSILPWFTDYDYPFSIFWPLCCLSFFDLRIMIIPLVSFGHCVVCPSLIYGLWLSLWYPLAIVLSVLLWFTDYDYPFSIFWPLCCLSFFDLRIMIIPLVSFGYCVVCPLIYGLWFSLWYLLAIVLSVLLWFTDYDYPFGIFWPLCCLSFDLRIMIIPLVSFGHCLVCPSLIYGLWLSL
jgi:hypothetical protein